MGERAVPRRRRCHCREAGDSTGVVAATWGWRRPACAMMGQRGSRCTGPAAHGAGGAEDGAGRCAAGTTMAKRWRRDQEMLTVGGE
jgi:hypothetical protein